MKLVLFLAVGSLCMVSCKEAQEMANKAKEAVVETVEEVKEDLADSVPQAADATMQSLVDQNCDGYRFRKDLPFPSLVKVKTRSGMQFKGRHFQASLLGQASGVLDGEFRKEIEIDRNGGEASVSLGEQRFFPRSAGSDESSGEEKAVSINPPMALEMVREGNSWKQSAGDPNLLTASAAAPHMADQFTKEGAMPRPFWFGSRRLKPGDEVALSGKHLAMTGMNGAKGEVRLKFEAVEPVNGHPCGVFLISGSFDGGESSLFGGDMDQGRCTIESGKLWMSLIHPVVLKEEIRLVVTSKEGRGKKISNHIQGAADLFIDREWIALPKS